MIRPGPRAAAIALAAFGAVAGQVLGAGTAHAQACCAATGGDDLAVVHWCHRAALAADLGFEHGFGTFGPDGRYDAFDDDQAAEDLSLTLAAGYRPVERLQVNAQLPLRLQHRRLAGLDPSWRARQGDAATSARWRLVAPGPGVGFEGPRWLEVELGTHLKLPTGVPTEDGTDLASADVTSDGALELGASLLARVAAGNANTFSLRAFFAHPFARDVAYGRATTHVALGEKLGLRALWSHNLTVAWHVGAFVDTRVTTRTVTNGAVVPGSHTPRLRIGAFLLRSVMWEDWDYLVAVSADPPFDTFTRNVPFATAAVSVGVQRNLR